MNVKIPLNFTGREAKIALEILEILIDMLIDLYTALQREYEPWTLEEDPEFGQPPGED